MKILSIDESARIKHKRVKDKWVQSIKKRQYIEKTLKTKYKSKLGNYTLSDTFKLKNPDGWVNWIKKAQKQPCDETIIKWFKDVYYSTPEYLERVWSAGFEGHWYIYVTNKRIIFGGVGYWSGIYDINIATIKNISRRKIGIGMKWVQIDYLDLNNVTKTALFGNFKEEVTTEMYDYFLQWWHGQSR